MKRFVIIILGCLLLCSCNDDRVQEAFAQNEGVRLQVGGAEQFRYESLSCQLSFNRERKVFRAMTDNASDFFIANFSELPEHIGQSLTADLTWTTFTDILTRKNLALEVIRIEDSTIWLWSRQGRIGLCIKIL